MPALLANELTREHGLELLRVERAELKRLRTIYEEGRKEVLDRLMAAGSGTFTEQHLRVSQAQIEAGLGAMIQKIEGATGASMVTQLENGVRQTLAQINFWEPDFQGGATGAIRLDALRKVTTPQGLLLHKFDNSLRSYGQGLVAETQRRLGVHLVLRSGWSEMSLDIAGRLKKNGIKGSLWKAERIVRTEMADAINAGHHAALEAAEEVLVGLKRQWDSTIDMRTSEECIALHEQIRKINEAFEALGQKFARPPAIPNCRSQEIPFHPRWRDEKPKKRPTEQVPKKAPIKKKSAAKKIAKKAAAKKFLPQKAAAEARKKRLAERLSEIKDPETRSLVDFETRRRDRKFEYGTIIDPDGKVIVEKTSRSPKQVKFTRAETKKMSGNRLSHNHPNGAGFSDDDIKVLSFYGLKEIRAVGTKLGRHTDKNYLYSMKPAKGAKLTPTVWRDTIQPEIKRVNLEIAKEKTAAIKAGTMSPSEAWFKFAHERWGRIADRTGYLDYERTILND